jgi:hypothetical protein
MTRRTGDRVQLRFDSRALVAVEAAGPLNERPRAFDSKTGFAVVTEKQLPTRLIAP